MAGDQAEGLMVDRSLMLSYTLVLATDFAKEYTNVRFTPFLSIWVCQEADQVFLAQVLQAHYSSNLGQ